MKKNLIMAAAAVIVIAMAGVAFAATTTATVNASATVAAVCDFPTNGTVAFGALDQIVGGAVSATVTNPTFWCTKSYAYTITDDNGLNETGTTYRLKAVGTADYIPYTFSYTSTGSGLGKTTSLSPAISASIAAGAYDNVPADSYADTVTLTITY